LNHFEKADKDATKAIDLDGGVNMKAYFRRGLARKGLGKFNLAKKGQYFANNFTSFPVRDS